jgi:ABC-2 type transport system permease protein
MISQKETYHQQNKLHNQGNLLLGINAFVRKELQEWQQKTLVVVVLIALPLLVNIFIAFVTKFIAVEIGVTLPKGNITGAGSFFALNGLWVSSVAILLSIGLIAKELDSGTLAWSLTKPLSRTSFLLGKWLVTSLVAWLIGIVLANIITVIISSIVFGWSTPRLDTIAIANFVGLCHVGFWVLLCLFLGVLLKDQAAVGAGALITAFGGFVIPNLPDQKLRGIAPFYPSNTVDWAVSSDSFSKFIAYLIYMLAMAIIAKLIFDRKEFS